MDDFDFLQGLKDEDDKREEFFAAATSMLANKVRSEPQEQEPIEKQAATLESVAELLKNRRAMAGAAAGAGVLGLGTYLASKPRPGPDGSRSSAERAFDSILAGQKDESQAGFATKMKNRFNEYAAGISKTFREHPGKATATLAVPVGALFGYQSARLLGAKGK